MKKAFDYFTIFGVMRTGSNLLQRNLDQVRGLTCHGELFNPAFIGKAGAQEYLGITLKDRKAAPEKVIKKIISEAGRETIPGFRFFNDHDHRIQEQTLADPTCAKIILRRSPLDSFISLKIARQTDQWMLGNIKKRRTATVHFDLHEYLRYRTATEQYYADLHLKLQTLGQTAFYLDYENINDISILNGLAHYIGSSGRLSGLKKTIHRQNPAKLQDKVENYQEMQDLLARAGGLHISQPQSLKKDKVDISACTISNDIPLLFYAIPGSVKDEALSWLEQFQTTSDKTSVPKKNSGDQRLKGFSTERALSQWMHQTADGVSFTIVRHPLLRAYHIFTTDILWGGMGFGHIRAHLEEEYDVALPSKRAAQTRDTLEKSGYGAMAHRIGFIAFLNFLKRSLSGESAIRVDPRWAPQIGCVKALHTVMPSALIAREHQLIKTAAHIRNLFDHSHIRNAMLRQTEPDHIIPLSEIYDDDIETLARSAMETDYIELGYGAWPTTQVDQ